MKSMIASLVFLAFFLLVKVSTASAQEVEQKQSNTEQVCTGFVDNNGDGVCDHYDGKRPGKGYGPGHGNGEGRAEGKRLGRRDGTRDGKAYGERRLDGSGPRQGMRRGLRDGSGPRCRVVPER
jgi:hypothetical protein